MIPLPESGSNEPPERVVQRIFTNAARVSRLIWSGFLVCVGVIGFAAEVVARVETFGGGTAVGTDAVAEVTEAFFKLPDCVLEAAMRVFVCEMRLGASGVVFIAVGALGAVWWAIWGRVVIKKAPTAKNSANRVYATPEKSDASACKILIDAV